VDQLLEFDWPSMRAALEGQSFIDVPSLNVENKVAAKRFLLCYGYDIDDSSAKEEVWRIYFQSISFIRDQLLRSNESIPSELLSRGPQSDILKLLVDASRNRKSPRSAAEYRSSERLRGRWSCAILRVMHIISHLDNDIRLEYFSYARNQIFSRFDEHVLSNGSRRWKFGTGNSSIPLVRYIKKERKERNSILIKLLSKPQAVVEDIYDRIGVRFVTENRFDCYRLAQKILATGAVSAPNLQPGRAVNTLIPFDVLHATVEQTRKDFESGSLSARMAKRNIKRLEDDYLVPLGLIRNPNSSRWYRAIQFTGRQLVTAPDPTWEFWTGIRSSLVKSKEAQKILKTVPISLRETRTFYYPFEVQILDLESYVESIGGRSRHRDYKNKQKLMARNRVLRDLI
jgi:uncharacterized protein (TIGR04562 family)